MAKRYLSLWFSHLLTDYQVRCRPKLKDSPFVLATPERGRMVVKAANNIARQNGVHPDMVVADCRALLPTVRVLDYEEGRNNKLLHALAEWCIRYTPSVAVDRPDGLLLDISGCPHLWGGETPYFEEIILKLKLLGYSVRGGIADTIGCAWAVARYGQATIIPTGKQVGAIISLPPAALRLEQSVIQRLEKLGLYKVQNFITMPRSALRRRFGEQLLIRLGQAIGQEIETIEPVVPVVPYQERLPSLDPICTATGIEIAIKDLLAKLCKRLEHEHKGLRSCIFQAFRIDGNIQRLTIGTNSPSRNVMHLFRLFEVKLETIEPALGIELFLLEAPVVEDLPTSQEAFWDGSGKDEKIIAELLDRISCRFGTSAIRRFLPDEHYWPERSVKQAPSLTDKPVTQWRTDMPRPLHLLSVPEMIEVTVPMPDYPPMLFSHKGKLHRIIKADGPERIEQEWWLNEGLYRDYYCVEDDKGARYWLFRSGSYQSTEPKWFVHGFFA